MDIDEKLITNRSIGRILAKLRLKEVSRAGGKGSRKRQIVHSELKRLIRSYGLPLPTSSAETAQMA